MVELLLNKNNTYSPDIVRALLHTVSLYPIGTYVYLKNRKIAIVTDTVSDNPKCPIVQLVTEKQADGSPVILETENPEYAILRVLTKQEQSDVLKVVEEKRKLIEEAQKIAMELNTPTKSQNESQKQEEKVPEKKESVKATFNENETEEVDISFFN